MVRMIHSQNKQRRWPVVANSLGVNTASGKKPPNTGFPERALQPLPIVEGQPGDLRPRYQQIQPNTSVVLSTHGLDFEPAYLPRS